MLWNDAREAIAKSSQGSSVYIGCDSQVEYKRDPKTGKKVRYADYATVVILHMDSRHGCKIFHDHVREVDYGSNKNLVPRLMMEVNKSIEAYEAIKDVLGDRYHEIHLDVNSDPIHASNAVTAQAIGWVKGLGLEARIKPEAFAASRAADQCVRRKGHFN